jgi:hypothetical protein
MLVSTAGIPPTCVIRFSGCWCQRLADFKPAQIAGGNNAVDLATRIFWNEAHPDHENRRPVQTDEWLADPGPTTGERSIVRFDLYPARLMGDSAYGSGEMLVGQSVSTVIKFDKSARTEGTFSRDDFTFDPPRRMAALNSPLRSCGTASRTTAWRGVASTA